jgi:hypothetical protein
VSHKDATVTHVVNKDHRVEEFHMTIPKIAYLTLVLIGVAVVLAVSLVNAGAVLLAFLTALAVVGLSVVFFQQQAVASRKDARQKWIQE